MKRTLSLLFALLVLLAGCGTSPDVSTQSSSSSSAPVQPSPSEEKQEHPKQKLPFTLGAYPAYSFHPVLANSQVNTTLAPLLYESLFILNPDFTVSPVLCQSYSSTPDFLVWTFQLKSGITFSDGTPLTGEVVAQALELAQGETSRYAARLAEVRSIEGMGDQVVITLAQPNASFPLRLDIPIALGDGMRPLGTGPYVLHEEEEALSLQPRSGWWRESQMGSVPSIPLLSLNQGDDMISAFTAGDVTLMEADLTVPSELGYSGSYEVWDYDTTHFLYLGFQTKQGVCKAPQVRQAIARSVDRTKVADTLFARHAKPTTLPVHPDSVLYNQGLAQDLSYYSQAWEGVEPEGKSLTMLVNIESTVKSAVANQVAQQLERAGFQVTVKRLPWEDYIKALEKGDFDLYLGETYLTADFDLSPLLAPEGALNYGGWNDPRTQALLLDLSKAQGDGRTVAANALFRHLNQWVPIAPICFQNGSVLTQYGRLGDLNPVQGNVFANLSGWTVQ